VVYGVVGLKTHAKMLLIMRREGKIIKRYAHLSTGNYNPKTAKLYTDICMLTSDANVTREMEYVFRYLTSELPLPRMQQLLVAPFTLQSSMLTQIKKAQNAAAKGQPASIVAKMNSLTDEVLVHALISAATKGVQIDLIVRGACILPVDLPQLQGRVRVRSIVGRLLEHSRVFYFNINGDINIWLSSADWMSRNMTRRVEVAWPIHDAIMQKRIIEDLLTPYLQDSVDAFELGAQGEYKPVRAASSRAATSLGCQALLIKKHNG
jgi:polyphosphate kinase